MKKLALIPEKNELENRRRPECCVKGRVFIRWHAFPELNGESVSRKTQKVKNPCKSMTYKGLNVLAEAVSLEPPVSVRV